jgi:uncharacterized peroxidase-related enzyme
MKTDYRKADLDTPMRALLDYAVKLTRTPGQMEQKDIQRLSDAGWSDTAIHDATQVIGYFNYINRIADALRVDTEPDMPPYPEKG